MNVSCIKLLILLAISITGGLVGGTVVAAAAETKDKEEE